MIEQDTIRLLRECDAGIKMGIATIDDVIDHVQGDDMQSILSARKREYEKMQTEIQELLHKYNDDGKEPSIIARGMSWMKTGVKLGTGETDAAAADLVTGGSNMGIKSLNRYLNRYAAADEASKNLAKRLIDLGDALTHDMRRFL